jgi:hypothetical protein
MPERKSRRTSPEIEQAEIQLATIINRIDPNLQLGEGETTQTYADAIANAQQELEAYPAAEALEAQRIKLKAAEKKVR